jgi:hypothetical protein
MRIWEPGSHRNRRYGHNPAHAYGRQRRAGTLPVQVGRGSRRQDQARRSLLFGGVLGGDPHEITTELSIVGIINGLAKSGPKA